MPDSADIRASLSLSLGAAYIIDRELESGGGWRLFVAKEESRDHDLVVKVLPDELTATLSFGTWSHELRAAATLDEPHTVPILGCGRTATGRFYYTMPHVGGFSLRDRLEEGPMGFDESVAVLRDVARSLSYSHRRGLVHRNLMPEAVLLAKDTAVVTEFGLAQAFARARDGGAIVQPPLPYTAPELASGDAEVDHRADLYAWGMMAYEMLLDADLFADALPRDDATPVAPVAETPPLLLFKRHGVPEQLAVLVMRCCEKDPAARPVSADELLTVLDRIPDPKLALAIESKHAARWIGASIVAALALFVVSGMAVFRMNRREAKQPPLLAVLPFETSGAVADSLFAEELGDALSARLSQLAGLRVIDRMSVLSALDTNVTARDVGRTLGADYVLTGSMRWLRGPDSLPRVRISPLVVRVSDGTSKWAGEPELVSLADPFTVQTTLATKTANELDVFLGPREQELLATQQTRDTSAFSAYARGNRLLRQNAAFSVPMLRQALTEFEHAYQRDPRYAAALGGAALVLVRLAEYDAQPALADSAATLARRSLAFNPGQARALSAAAALALAQERPEEAEALAERAVEANPSGIEALKLRAALLPMVGDSTGTWRDVERLAALAPRSVDALIVAATSAQAVRRYTDAGELLQRARLLEPERVDVILLTARLARTDGDFRNVPRIVREFRRRGGHISTDDLSLLRVGDNALQAELAESPPSAFYAEGAADSVNFYTEKAKLFLARRDTARARGLLDSSSTLLHRLAADSTASASQRRKFREIMAWTDAARGERKSALAAVSSIERAPIAQQWPNGQLAAYTACNSAEIYGFLDDVEQMIPQLRRCLTLPGGYAPTAISAEPALWRHAPDLRLRALLAEFNLQVRRKT
jgi:serine/threonine-protein kinase